MATACSRTRVDGRVERRVDGGVARGVDGRVDDRVERRAHARADGRRQRGFTLLEVEAAIVLLSLLIVGFMKLVWHHEELAAACDRWCQDSPDFFVAVSDDDLERALGVPARLVMSQPDPVPGPPDPGLYDVDVTSFSKQLDPAAASATALLTLHL